MNPITILLVDDHALFREGLASLLRARPNIQLVGAASSGEEALTLAQELMPDLVLMDVRMPGLGGIETTRRIKMEMPAVRVVMLTMSEDAQDLFQALKNGAQGYLLKNTKPDELDRFIAGVMDGEAAFSGLMATKMLEEFRRPDDVAAGENGREKLTAREWDVLQHVADGLTNRDIGAKLAISENTVKKHLRNILAKLHLQNRVQAVLFVQRQAKPKVDA
jgi:two-component system, NarL family, nitrate/nitrite response regulator NarL